MISIGVITRGKYGLRIIDNIQKNSDFSVSSIEIPELLPDFIEAPAEFISDLNLDKSVFSSDLVIAYTLHPDLAPEIVRLAGENGAGAVIIAGGEARAGGHSELLNLSEKYNMHIEVHEICCTIEMCGNKIVDKFASCFGKPELKITTEAGLITRVEVIRGAPCGSTWHMAKGLAWMDTRNAPSRGGLLVQQYPCRALRGNRGGIHKAAKLHKDAVEKALKESG
ncbi:Thymidylate synthase [uncultured archaeon]|nr:Thymidylate synthase [uncultured archaeon]